MTGVSRRGRSRDWIQRFIHNARLYQPGTAMPRYEIPLEDLEALSIYLLSLDPRKEIFEGDGSSPSFGWSVFILKSEEEGKR